VHISILWNSQSILSDLVKMPFSHHSHSGQFCGHATGTLEEMIQTAISKGMKVFALTEHMPREVEDFYPEEVLIFSSLLGTGLTHRRLIRIPMQRV
jgi:histidinol phosphatase-like PHP family hydrolase